MLELCHVDKTYNPGSVTQMCLFKDFDLCVPTGQFVSVVGSNGSGKTSLLNIICGSIQPDAGCVRMDGTDITARKEHLRYRHMGRVYQDPALGACGSLTVLENLSLAANKGRAYGLGAAVRRRQAAALRGQLAALGLGLEDKLNAKMASLSGGQRQAVALLMATMTPLDFLILDEHTAALDPRTAEIIMQLTDRIVREKKLTAIMVTHNLRYAVEYGDRLLMMDRGQIVLDLVDGAKKQAGIDDLLKIFNAISIECGN